MVIFVCPNTAVFSVTETTGQLAVAHVPQDTAIISTIVSVAPQEVGTEIV